MDATTPADDAPSVPVGADIVLTFDEAVQEGTGNIAVFNAAGLVEEVSAADAVFDGNTVTVDLAADLEPGTEYFFVRVTEGVEGVRLDILTFSGIYT
jgi:methionine-rich copper-binding protein CopC